MFFDLEAKKEVAPPEKISPERLAALYFVYRYYIKRYVDCQLFFSWLHFVPIIYFAVQLSNRF